MRFSSGQFQSVQLSSAQLISVPFSSTQFDSVHIGAMRFNSADFNLIDKTRFDFILFRLFAFFIQWTQERLVQKGATVSANISPVHLNFGTVIRSTQKSKMTLSTVEERRMTKEAC